MNTNLSTDVIRKAFTDYFVKQKHTSVPSSSLIPVDDPTLLFTNAGMVQFKNVFLGLEKRNYTRAVSIQRCVRAGGKHNDLENVGYTARHHTFFEMLGNFSFGDYFKKPAIQFAWDFLTKVLQIPQEKLWVTVFREDRESEDIWLKEIGVDPKRFSRCGEKDNFWSMGDVGPCGPCTEIFYDHGEKIAGGPPGSPNESGDRYTEIWNLVFMQYNRDIAGKLTPLPKPCVDTGMGLERIAAVMQGVHDNFDTDLFQSLLSALSELVHCHDKKSTAMRVIVDHIRATAFLIADGITPSNEGRGYVLRRIIRRAARYGFKLEQQKPFFYRMVAPLVKVMGSAYPELATSKALIEKIIEQEEKQFSNTLSKGLKILDKALEEKPNEKIISGALMFQLYDTFGFPSDLTIDIARERGLQWDMEGFQEAMSRQREQSQQFMQFNRDQTQQVHLVGETIFTGYEKLTDEGKVITLLHDLKPVTKLQHNEKGIVILDKTPFYAESGGQVGDSGYLYFQNGSFRVHDTQKKGTVYLHYGQMVSGLLTTGTIVRAEVDNSRQSTRLNHSATHLLHEALRRTLGEHVTQKGSLVEAKRLRFDFSHSTALTQEQIYAIERLVNQQIRANFSLHTNELALDEAKKEGALALFSEKYAARVRVVTMGDFSKEICGGTHVTRTGDIGLFKIIAETACAAGVRRIEAVTGSDAVLFVEKNEQLLQDVARELKVDAAHVVEKLAQLMQQNKQLSREALATKQKMATQSTDTLHNQTKIINQIRVVVAEVAAPDRETLRHIIDQLKQQPGESVILLACVQNNEVLLIASVSKSILSIFTAPDVLQVAAKCVNGKGGGRPDLAQGGGDDVSALAEALETTQQWITEKLQHN